MSIGFLLIAIQYVARINQWRIREMRNTGKQVAGKGRSRKVGRALGKGLCGQPFVVGRWRSSSDAAAPYPGYELVKPINNMHNTPAFYLFGICTVTGEKRICIGICLADILYFYNNAMFAVDSNYAQVVENLH